VQSYQCLCYRVVFHQLARGLKLRIRTSPPPPSLTPPPPRTAPSSPASLPVQIYCVLRSPHVNKDSREHFEIRTHQRLIDIKNINSETVDRLMSLDIPAGVDVKVKV
jgi:hypothetical protein